MTNLADIRQKYPQYNDLSDQQLADAFHQKYYPDLPVEQFYSKIGFNQNTENETNRNQDNDYFKQIKKQHPILGALAEKLHGTPGLGAAGNIAGHVSNAVEGTYLPSIARGGLDTGVQIGRGLANLIPGVNIPRQQLPKLNVNPFLGEFAEIAGSFGLPAKPVQLAYKGVKGAINLLPYAEKIPEALKAIGTGGAVGSAITPDHRLFGAGIGAAAPAATEAVAKYLNARNPRKLAPGVKTAQEIYEAAEARHHLLQSEAGHKFNMQDPERLAFKAQDLREALQEAQHQHGLIPFENLNNRLPHPSGEQYPEQAQHILESTLNRTSHALGEKQAHTNRFSQSVVPTIEAVHKSINKDYEAIHESLEGKHVSLPREPDIKSIEAHVEKSTSKTTPKEIKEQMVKKLIEAEGN